MKMRDHVPGRGKPAILLIDGSCRLCHAIFRFVVKRDRAGAFRFAAIQSDMGRLLLVRGGLPTDDVDTFVLVDGGRYYTKSAAALRVFRRLDGLWPLMYLCRAVPAPVRNRVYDLIASRRYKWFGREETCRLPAGDLQNRWVEEEEVHDDER